MNSKSSNDRSAERLPVGRVHGHRGRGGELTVRVQAGDAARWLDVPAVWVETGEDFERFTIEAQRAYRDRWVLKLTGIDDATSAAELRGAHVEVERDEAPRLAEHEHWNVDLVGLRVVDTQGGEIGRVSDVRPTGGVDLLVVEDGTGNELLVPMHREIVVDVNESEGWVRIDPPDGLLDLNR